MQKTSQPSRLARVIIPANCSSRSSIDSGLFLNAIHKFLGISFVVLFAVYAKVKLLANSAGTKEDGNGTGGITGKLNPGSASSDALRRRDEKKRRRLDCDEDKRHAIPALDNPKQKIKI